MLGIPSYLPEKQKLISNLEKYSKQLDYLYNYIEEYQATKHQFLSNIASASSYILKIILLGNKKEYNKLRKNLSVEPESVIHSFETVLETEAPLEDNDSDDSKVKLMAGGYYNDYDKDAWKEIAKLYLNKKSNYFKKYNKIYNKDILNIIK